MRLLAIGVAALALAACTGSQPKQTTGPVTPEWMVAGSGPYTAEGASELRAVGTSSNPDPRARRKAADDAARAELDRLVRGGTEAPPAGCARLTAKDAEIADHFVDRDGTEYALARLLCK
jgi:hypothetical protein